MSVSNASTQLSTNESPEKTDCEICDYEDADRVLTCCATHWCDDCLRGSMIHNRDLLTCSACRKTLEADVCIYVSQ